jgi:hypothetical protein
MKHNTSEVIDVIPLEISSKDKQHLVAAFRVFFSSNTNRKMVIKTVRPSSKSTIVS